MNVLDLESDAVNQHFVSRAEQRLNALNPNASDQNKRIYEFDVLDRDAPTLNLRQPGGRGIAGVLSTRDLFTFDVSEGVRRSLEAMFHESEATVASQSLSLLDKLNAGTTGPEIKSELLDVFGAKVQNFARNPWCIRKSLNTFGTAADFTPTDPEFREAYERVVDGNKPHRAHVCRIFGVMPAEYDRWLRMLFTLLCPMPAPQLRMIDAWVKDLFELNHVSVAVAHYPQDDSSDVCLLSDRGLNSQPTDTGVAFEWNISARAFAIFLFTDPGKVAEPRYATFLRGQTVVHYEAGNLDVLASYNQRTVFQCAHRVFAASKSPRLRKV